MPRTPTQPSLNGNVQMNIEPWDTTGASLPYANIHIGYEFQNFDYLRQALRLKAFIPPAQQTPHNNNEVLARIGFNLVQVICLLHLSCAGISLQQVVLDSLNHPGIDAAITNFIINSEVPAHAERENGCVVAVLTDHDYKMLGYAIFAAVFLDSGCNISELEQVMRSMGVHVLPPNAP